MFQCSNVPEHFENRGGGQIILFCDMNYMKKFSICDYQCECATY